MKKHFLATWFQLTIWAAEEASVSDQGTYRKESGAMFGRIPQIGGAYDKISTTISIAPSPK